jgi:hypothetical protein
LRFLDAPPKGRALASFVDSVAEIAGVSRVRARPNTGSVIVETAVPADMVLHTLAASGLMRLEPHPHPQPVRQTIRSGLAHAEAKLERQTEGALDLRTTIALGLLAGAIFQLSRGKVGGPATTLAMAAFALLDKSGDENSDPDAAETGAAGDAD